MILHLKTKGAMHNRTFSRLWRHFTTTTRILLVFVFSCKLKVLFFAVHSDYKIEFEKENEMNSGSCSKMTPS